MLRSIRTMAAIILSLALAGITTPALAEDAVPVTVEVVSTEGAPQIKAFFGSPVGKKSDAAKLSVQLTGLEPNRVVFFKVTPLNDAIARANTDSAGALTTKVELPYGLEPGMHELVASTVFSTDDIPASYTIGQFFVNDFGVLTNQDGSYPKGTRPAKVLLPNSGEKFDTAPEFLKPSGDLRISEPQLRISQGFLPSVTAGLTLNNGMSTPTSFEAKITLTTLFGIQIGSPFYAKFEGLAAGESSTVLLNFGSLPPLGFFTVHTQLLLPDNFVSQSPVQTTQSSTIFVWPVAPLAALGAILLAAGILVRRRMAKVAV